MASKSSDADGGQPSLLNDERHPVFDTWETLDTFNPPAASSDESGWSESFESSSFAEPLGPINWNTLGADDAAVEWLYLNAWVNWLRGPYGLAPPVVPPMWHRPDQLAWGLPALHLPLLTSLHRKFVVYCNIFYVV